MTIAELIAACAEKKPNSVAIGAPKREPLTYLDLKSQVELTVKSLNASGVGREDRVAVVLPNGPELAVAFVSVAAGATCAPLNPSYRTEEFEFYLDDLNAKALLVLKGSDSPAVSVARNRGITILELACNQIEPAGIFTIQGETSCEDTTGGFAETGDIALVLHTSGTTSRPKIVPLTHSNICASAKNIGQTLSLNGSDRCLNVMPLFHIHGLIGAVLASLAAGAEVICTPRFDALKFFSLVKEFQPSWYTAVPTMHQTILARAHRNQEVISNNRLRFIRSSSAALPPKVLEKLELVFQIPVIESYGMTEASHQMASNPLPPEVRKPGSVGFSAGPEMGIMDTEGKMLKSGDTGEVVIRGTSVTKRYENNPEANAASFSGGWFRTGDQGYFDKDGYLYITGRLKEIINRGGEKISPREVDEVLMDHPAVEQAVTFGLPHRTLGEDVGAAVILREGFSVSDKELRNFVAGCLVDFKVPRRIIFLETIPKGPTGKLQRIGLAEKLGLA